MWRRLYTFHPPPVRSPDCSMSIFLRIFCHATDIALHSIRPSGSICKVKEMALLTWGLIPSWATDPSIGNKHLNARSESVGEKPSFREAIRHRRCIIPADGFYEWQATESGKKQPYLMRRSQPGIMAFAGLWDCWVGPDDKIIESCSILTTSAKPNCCNPLHDPMPVIIEPSDLRSGSIARLRKLRNCSRSCSRSRRKS